jgi:hypothetical protein
MSAGIKIRLADRIQRIAARLVFYSLAPPRNAPPTDEGVLAKLFE